jgi:hypothetical protein
MNKSNMFLFICMIGSLCKIFIFFLCFDDQGTRVHWKVDDNEILNFFSFGFFWIVGGWDIDRLLERKFRISIYFLFIELCEVGTLIDWLKRNVEFFAFHFLFLFTYIFFMTGTWGHSMIDVFFNRFFSHEIIFFVRDMNASDDRFRSNR